MTTTAPPKQQHDNDDNDVDDDASSTAPPTADPPPETTRTTATTTAKAAGTGNNPSPTPRKKKIKKVKAATTAGVSAELGQSSSDATEPVLMQEKGGVEEDEGATTKKKKKTKTAKKTKTKTTTSTKVGGEGSALSPTTGASKTRTTETEEEAKRARPSSTADDDDAVQGDDEETGVEVVTLRRRRPSGPTQPPASSKMSTRSSDPEPLVGDDRDESPPRGHRKESEKKQKEEENENKGRDDGSSSSNKNDGVRNNRPVGVHAIPPMVESGSDDDDSNSGGNRSHNDDDESTMIPLSSRVAPPPTTVPPTSDDGPRESEGPQGSGPAKTIATVSEAKMGVPSAAAISNDERRTILAIHAVLVGVLLLSAVGVGVGAYYYASSSQRHVSVAAQPPTVGEEEDEASSGAASAAAFQAISRQVVEGVGTRLEAALAGMDDLQTSLVAQVRSANQTWPFVSFSNFASEATRVRYRSGMAPYLALHPLVTANIRTAWEAYTTAVADKWIVKSLQVQSTDELYEGPTLFQGNVLNTVHDSYYQPVPANHEVVFPTWQSSPVVARLPCYNWDLFSLENNRAINRTFRSARPVLGESYLVPHNGLGEVEAKWWSDRFRDYPPYSRNRNEPISNLYYPVVDWDQEGLRTPQIVDPVVPGNGNTNSSGPRLVGVLMMIMYWRDLLMESSVSLGSYAMDLVVSNPCQSSPFTYRLTHTVDGKTTDVPKAVYMGLIDTHGVDPTEASASSLLPQRYSRLLSTLIDNYTSRETSWYTGLPLDHDDSCPFTVTAYYPVSHNASSTTGDSGPSGSDAAAANNVTAAANDTTPLAVDPIVSAVVASAIVVWTSLVFVVHALAVRAYRNRNRPSHPLDAPDSVPGATAADPAAAATTTTTKKDPAAHDDEKDPATEETKQVNQD